jgi:hypothetical protein
MINQMNIKMKIIIKIKIIINIKIAQFLVNKHY